MDTTLNIIPDEVTWPLQGLTRTLCTTPTERPYSMWCPQKACTLLSAYNPTNPSHFIDAKVMIHKCPKYEFTAHYTVNYLESLNQGGGTV